MNLALILRAEAVCLIILLYLTFISRAYRMGKDARVFNFILLFAVMHVVMDVITVHTVNHTDTVPLWANNLAHGLFYLSAILFAYEICLYTIEMALMKKLDRDKRLLALIPVILYTLLLFTPLLTIEYIQLDGTKSSTGTAPILAYVLSLAYYVSATLSIMVHWKKISRHFKGIMLPTLVLLFVSVTIQINIKEFLFTDCAVTAITVAFFFTLENPAAVLERKVMLDALSGLGTRSGYERDMAEYDREFEENKDTRFIFLFIDISNLRKVNGLYGQEEGDNYISHVAVLLTNNLKKAEHIYRMGGDEFLAIYRKMEEEVVVRDIKRIQEACRKEQSFNETVPELAVGYAISDPKYSSLRDVLRVADYMMFRNKADLKREIVEDRIRNTGTHMNLTGLTDRVFDAMCLTSEEYYPYLTNMETNVTRVAPAMVEYFGLEGEFLDNFHTVWAEHVHPDDRQEFMSDLAAAVTGRKQYHFCTYRAMNRNGEYVQISCRGGLYHGRDGEPDVFAGYMVNNGTVGTVDGVTGLRNHQVMFEQLRETFSNGQKGVLMLLEIRNLNRIRTLYGGETTASLIRNLSGDFTEALGGNGEVFSEHGSGFLAMLPDYDETKARELYRRIRKHCKAGVLTDDEVIPVDITGGAVKLPDETLTTPGAMRQAALFAAEEAHNRSSSNLLFFAESGQETGTSNKDLLQAIHHDCVTERSHFYLRFQPIIRAQTGELTGAEALLRWSSDEYGEVAPGRFIAFLEDDPAYEPLGYDIIRSAVRIAGKIRGILPGFRINVNITAGQLLLDDFIPRVLKILSEERYEPSALMLELTERCKEIEFKLLNERVMELKRTGIRVALDDMGTGYSTIDLLLHLPANEVKLDMAFTRELQGMEKHEMLTNTLCSASARDGTDVCFEGVETRETAEYLKGYGDVLLQGYYFDKPLLPTDFMEKYCKTAHSSDQ